MKNKYKNPPIEEAVVEFHFAPSQEWDLTIPGKLHAHSEIKNQYSGKPRTQKHLEAAFRSGSGQTPNLAVREGLGRVQLIDVEQKQLLSLGIDVLSVNILKPYVGWEAFRPRIETALLAYFEVAQPNGVKRIGVRYINKIVLSGSDINIETYFKYILPTSTQLPKKIGGFVSRMEYIYDDSIKLLLTQATVDAPEGQSAFLADLDVIWEGAEKKRCDEIMQIVDNLHEREGEAFEAIITDAAREVFNED